MMLSCFPWPASPISARANAILGVAGLNLALQSMLLVGFLVTINFLGSSRVLPLSFYLGNAVLLTLGFLVVCMLLRNLACLLDIAQKDSLSLEDGNRVLRLMASNKKWSGCSFLLCGLPPVYLLFFWGVFSRSQPDSFPFLSAGLLTAHVVVVLCFLVFLGSRVLPRQGVPEALQEIRTVGLLAATYMVADHLADKKADEVRTRLQPL